MNRVTRIAVPMLVAPLATLALGGVAYAAPGDMCVAANGQVRMVSGSATCVADGQGSVARVKGSDSTATAVGERNKATVLGTAVGPMPQTVTTTPPR